ncbi:MAG: nitrilase-related carbon-nitrogen hydrolase [Candidatus Hodarchaeales archaeon]
MKSTQISLIQMDVVLGNKKANIEKAAGLIKQAVSRRNSNVPQIICLPELFSTGYDLKNVHRQAETIPGGKTTIFLQKNATDYSVVLVASYIEKVDDNYYNTAVVIDEEGTLLGKYRKIHLFPISPMDETSVFSIGGFSSSNYSFKLKTVNLGVLICFDLRFPELSRKMVLDGNTEILIYLAEFPKPRHEIWKRLLQARAIENQIYVCGLNRAGSDPTLEFLGNSVIFGPNGETIVEGGDKETILTSILDPERVQEVKKTLPSLQYRQPDYY